MQLWIKLCRPWLGLVIDALAEAAAAAALDKPWAPRKADEGGALEVEA